MSASKALYENIAHSFAIAYVVFENEGPMVKVALDGIVDALCDDFAYDNSRFSPDRFKTTIESLIVEAKARREARAKALMS